MYCNTHSTIFTAVRCSHLRKKVLRMDATSYRSSDRTVQHLCLWLQNEHEWKFCEEFAPHPRGTNDNDAHACEPNTLQCKIKLSQKYCPWINLQLWNFCHSFLQWMSSIFLDYYVLLCKIGSLAWTSSFVPPSWGANSSQSCRSCSLSGHKQMCWTVLYELRYKVAYNPNTFFVNWKQRTAGKAVEDALQYIIMYEAGVWAKTTKGYFENVVEQVIRRQSKVWSNL